MSIPPEMFAAVVQDEAIKARILKIVNGILADVEHTIKYGNRKERNDLLRPMVPYLFKAFRQQEAQEGERQATDAYAAVRELFQRFVPQTQEGADTALDEVGIDGPE